METFIVVGTVVSILLSILVLFIVYKTRRGSDWARIVLTIWIALSILSTLYNVLLGTAVPSIFSVYGQFFAVGVALSIVVFILNFAVIVLLWRPETGVWFRSISEGRRAHRAATETSTI